MLLPLMFYTACQPMSVASIIKCWYFEITQEHISIADRQYDSSAVDNN